MRYLTTLKYIDIVAKEGSMRKAAERLAITSTALNRRILAIEEEIGHPLFERTPSGVQLNTAGELFVQHIRNQISDVNRVLSQISDLSGIRRGHVRISSGAQTISAFLPKEIAEYRQKHPGVTFEILRHNSKSAVESLVSHESDIAIIFDSILPSDIHIVATVTQAVHIIMAPDHPLANKKTLRLQDCLAWPILMPRENEGIRTLLSVGQIQKATPLQTIIEADSFDMMANYLTYEHALTFQIPISMNSQDGIYHRLKAIPIDHRDCARGLLHIAQLKARVLPVAAAKFQDQLVQRLNDIFPEETR
ncbi:LysR family transcriptional regulator [Alphaproteobacteria bacterium]|nr:LysR family transcriptional regulator [Alphaproteobacteria bacterium]